MAEPWDSVEEVREARRKVLEATGFTPTSFYLDGLRFAADEPMTDAHEAVIVKYGFDKALRHG